MAKNINTTLKPYVVLHVYTTHKDGSVDTRDFKVDEMCENLRYVLGKKSIGVVSGRVADITYTINKKAKRFYSNIHKLQSYFKYDVIANTISIDSSEVNHSHLDVISVKDILEAEGVTDMTDISFDLSYGFTAEVLRSDNTVNTFEIKEGQVVNDLLYSFGGKDTLIESAKVVAIGRGQSNITPTTLYMNMNGVLKSVGVTTIISLGGSNEVISPSEKIGEKILALKDGDSLHLGTGTFDESLSISKSVKIMGAKADINPVVNPLKRNRITFEGETVLSGPINVNGAAVELELNGLVLTKEALLNITGATKLTLKNCIVAGITPTSKNVSYIKTGNGTPLEIAVENNYFAAFIPEENRNIYNFMNMDATLLDGSHVTGNYFEEGYNTNDGISIYNIRDGATITISGNTWEFAGNGIRIGTKGAPVDVTINIEDNTYNKTLDNSNAGLVCIQPYNRSTSSMAGLTIIMTNNQHNDDKRTWYMFQTKNDMEFTEETIPTVVEDGVKLTSTLETHYFKYS